jgi:general secretion pathway protein D
VKGRWMLAILLAVASLPGGTADAQDPPEMQGEAEQPLGEEEAMVLNFERADIREVIHSLATALGISYTIDPRIEGQVTIRTTGKIAREDLFPLLNQILRNNGIAAVKVGDLYQILPVAEAKTRAIIPLSRAERDAARGDDSFVIEIIPVRHVSADEMSNILQPFVSPGGDVLSYPRANLVVVTDLETNVERLRDLVNTFDSDIFRNLHSRVFKVKEGDPDELANELLSLLSPYGIGGTEAEGGGLYIIPLSRLDSLVAVAFDRNVLDEVERWLKLLDIPPEEGAGRQTFVYNVENAKAVDLAAVLNELFGGAGGSGGGGVGGRASGTPGGVGLFGAGGVSGGRGAGGGGSRGLGGGAAGQQGQALGQQAGGLGTAGGAGGAGGTGAGGGRSLGGRRGGGGAGGGGLGGAAGGGGAAGAPGGAGAARGISLPGRAGAAGGVPGAPGGGGPPPIFKEEVRIVADEVTNSLVILATKRDYQLILDVLRRIDVVPRQVLLEVTIAEVVLGDDMQFGVSYALAEGKLSDTVAQDNANPTSLLRNGPTGLPVGGLITNASRLPSSGAFAVFSSSQNFNIFINALAAKTKIRMLSAPHVIAADNREAHILVGDSIPILTSTASNVLTSGNAATVNSVQYRDTGKILTILPQVNSKGLVNMQIRQEVSAVGLLSFGETNSPSFSTREAETTVVVQDGETVLIGGIIDDSVSHSRTGIPFLMNAPVLGVLFRTTIDNVDRTELLIAITPYVVRDRDDARAVTDDFADQLQGFRRMGELMRHKHDKLRQRSRRTDAADTQAGKSPNVRAGDVVPREAAP